MIVLVGCECSQTVCKAFRARGHEAYSCDIMPEYGGWPEWHIQGDLREVYDRVQPDLFIAHPPCTYLTAVGAVANSRNPERKQKGFAARDFFLWCLSRPAHFVCVENPMPLRMYNLPKRTQEVQPWQFGEPYSKRTYLWLRNLPLLQPTNIVQPSGSWTALHSSVRMRCKTFDGIAAAMADQWGTLDINGLYQIC